MQKITPFLWFNDNAEEAMNYNISIFKDAKKVYVSHYGKSGPGPEGSVKVAALEIQGQELLLLNGGPQFKFDEAISFVVNCKDQAEVDYYWKELSRGGKTSQCGWLKDKFGLSWQIVFTLIWEVMKEDSEASDRVMTAVMTMTKLEVSELEKAAAGK